MAVAGKVGEFFFPNSIPFAYQTQRLVCEAPFGGGEMTEVTYALDRMTEDDFESWYEGWNWLGDIANRDGEAAIAAGNAVTARERLFAAANYYRSAEFFLPPDDAKMATWRNMTSAFKKAGELMDPPFEWIDWTDDQGNEMVGYLAKPPNASGPLPTVVYLNGADGTKEESWYLGGRPLVDRGVAVLCIEGPGQGEPLRVHETYTRPDYEAAVTPLVDLLVERDDVDSDRIGLVGISMGGYYAGRVASYEHRFRCVVLHGACFNIHDDLYENFPPIQPQLQWITGTFEDEPAREALKEFDLGDHLGNVQSPIYVTHGADDVLVAPAAAQKTWDALTVEDKTLKIWDEAENEIGGSIHCSLDNPTQAYTEIADWLRSRLTD
ncbi:MAG: alpha/beta hydrolase family protein [Solirubrobacterales bacterium]